MAFQQRGWHKLEEQTWREVAHHVGLREEAPGAGHRTGADQVAAAATSAPTRKHTLVGRGSSTGNRRETRRTTEAQSRSHHSHRSQHNRHRAKRWKGGFNEMLISSGGGPRPSTFPPHLPVTWGVHIHMRALAYGVWAGSTLADGSALNPNYWQTQQRGYMRARQSRQQTAPDPSGYMGVNVDYCHGGLSEQVSRRSGCSW